MKKENRINQHKWKYSKDVEMLLKDDLQVGSNYDSLIFKLEHSSKFKGLYEYSTGSKVKHEAANTNTAV